MSSYVKEKKHFLFKFQMKTTRRNKKHFRGGEMLKIDDFVVGEFYKIDHRVLKYIGKSDTGNNITYTLHFKNLQNKPVDIFEISNLYRINAKKIKNTLQPSSFSKDDDDSDIYLTPPSTYDSPRRSYSPTVHKYSPTATRKARETLMKLRENLRKEFGSPRATNTQVPVSVKYKYKSLPSLRDKAISSPNKGKINIGNWNEFRQGSPEKSPLFYFRHEYSPKGSMTTRNELPTQHKSVRLNRSAILRAAHINKTQKNKRL